MDLFLESISSGLLVLSFGTAISLKFCSAPCSFSRSGTGRLTKALTGILFYGSYDVLASTMMLFYKFRSNVYFKVKLRSYVSSSAEFGTFGVFLSGCG